MGTLKPGATYIYERNGDEVYAREFGETDRKLVGYGYNPFNPKIHNPVLWEDMKQEALTNPALQKALDRAIMIYRLSKDNPQ